LFFEIIFPYEKIQCFFFQKTQSANVSPEINNNKLNCNFFFFLQETNFIFFLYKEKNPDLTKYTIKLGVPTIVINTKIVLFFEIIFPYEKIQCFFFKKPSPLMYHQK